MKKTTSLLFLIFTNLLCVAQKNILFFVSQENTYYSEYIVMKEALEDMGYTIDVRSATGDPVSTYMAPSGTTIDATANTLAGSSYATFQQQYEDMFGAAWNESLNTIPVNLTTNGGILDISSMNNYYALVLAGGNGVLDYRYDGNYTVQGTVTATVVQQVAEKLNSLAVEALTKGKPILAQCHGASLPVYWRVPGTNGTGVESLGISILKNQYATGYPETETATTLADFGITYLDDSKVVLSTPNASLSTENKGNFKILTSRDWYPQTVAYAARALVNVIETFPSVSQRNSAKNVLILHGGALNASNCSPGNRTNDVPCNYGGGADLPADYSNLSALLSATGIQDEYTFSVDDLNITSASLPYNDNDVSGILTYLNSYDVVVFFKHWSTGVTENLQNALKNYAEDGGGLISLHHGLYNDIDGSLNKNILSNDLFQVESAMNTWSANLTNYSMHASNYGHFISNFGINYPDAVTKPAGWAGTPLQEGSNFSDSYYSAFQLYDELYNNMSFLNSPVFGRGINEITPLFSHATSPSSIYHTAGFIKLYNGNSDSKTGKLIYLQAGERIENMQTTHTYGQVIRNAVFWASIDEIEYEEEGTTSIKTKNKVGAVQIYPNPVSTDMVRIVASEEITGIKLTDIQGRTIPVVITKNNDSYDIRFQEEGASVLFLEVNTIEGSTVQKLIRQY